MRENEKDKERVEETITCVKKNGDGFALFLIRLQKRVHIRNNGEEVVQSWHHMSPKMNRICEREAKEKNR